MMGLLSLPIELIERVGEELDLDTRSQKNFRQTCAQVDLAVAPLLFSHLVIDVKKSRIGPSVSQLQSLALKSARIAGYVHTVEIRRLAPYFNPQSPFAPPDLQDLEAKWAYMKLEKHLAAALSTLSGVRTVIWHTYQSNPEWTVPAVANFLLRIPSLEHLYIEAWSDISSISLDAIANLRRLYIMTTGPQSLPSGLSKAIANSPTLTHLDVQICDEHIDETSPSLHSLLRDIPPKCPLRLTHLGIVNGVIRLDGNTLPHLRSLESLEVQPLQMKYSGDVLLSTSKKMLQDHGSRPRDIWEVLRREDINIQRTITPVTRAVLAYMSSCSGMRDIHLIIHKSRTDDRAYQFYTRILPRHAPTLTSLKIPVERDGLWCFGPHAIPALSKCKQLTSLTLTVTHKDVAQRPVETITSVMKMAAELPLLCELSIFTSGLGCDICGVGDPEDHKTRLLIYRAVTASIPTNSLRVIAVALHGALGIESLFRTARRVGGKYVWVETFQPCG